MLNGLWAICMTNWPLSLATWICIQVLMKYRSLVMTLTRPISVRIRLCVSAASETFCFFTHCIGSIRASMSQTWLVSPGSEHTVGCMSEHTQCYTCYDKQENWDIKWNSWRHSLPYYCYLTSVCTYFYLHTSAMSLINSRPSNTGWWLIWERSPM